MNFQQLDIFKRFIDEQNVSKVAKDLGLKQPTITFHLKKLEKEMRIKLYERKGDKISLLPAGATLYHYAGQILSLVKETERVMEDYKNHQRGKLFIGTSHIPANYLLPSVFVRFSNQHPSIHLSVQVQTTPVILEKVKEKELDVGIVSEQDLKDDAVEIRRLAPDPLVLIHSPHHPFVDREKVTLEEIRNEPFILHKNGSTREIVNQWARDHELPLHVKMELSSIEAIRKMVKMQAGISILSRRAIEQDVQRKELAVKPVPQLTNNRYISLIYRKDRPITPIMQYFITALYSD